MQTSDVASVPARHCPPFPLAAGLLRAVFCGDSTALSWHCRVPFAVCLLVARAASGGGLPAAARGQGTLHSRREESIPLDRHRTGGSELFAG